MRREPLKSVLILLIISAATYADESSTSITIEIAPQVVIEMMPIPAGKISTGPPAISNPTTSQSDELLPVTTMDVRPFYISTTEVTFAQLMPVLGAERVATIQRRIVATSGIDAQNQYLREAINSPDMPAFSLSFDDVIAACRLLTSQSAGSVSDANDSIEQRQFRAPSHLEWQYACRGVSDTKQAMELPHFNRWIEIDAMSREARARVDEEWKKLGTGSGALIGDQSQILQLVDSRLSQPDAGDAPALILGDFFREAMGIQRDFNAATGRLNPVRASTPNRWGIFDMHDNVCEWVVAIDSRDDFTKFWEQILSDNETATAQLKSRRCLLLAGGGFSQAAREAGAWKDFSIWGAFPMDRESDELLPYMLAEGLDNSNRSIAADLNPGFRLVLDRTLRPDWFAVVRSLATSGHLDAKHESIRQSTDAVTTPRTASQIKTYVTIYQSLLAAREIKGDGEHAELSEAFDALAQSMSSVSQTNTINALKMKFAEEHSTGSTATSTVVSDDEIFFKLLAEAVR